MIITQLELFLVELPYKEPIQWASVAESAGKYLLLRICTDEGLFGIAEAVDKPTWTGSTTSVTAGAIREVYEPALVGLDPLRLERVWAALNRIPGWGTPKALIDLALTDLASRNAGLPLWKYLGGWTDEVPVSWLINLGPHDQRIAEAQAAVDRYGFKALKVKVGKNPAEDVAYVRRLRETFGPSMTITLDANSLYSFQDGLRVAEGVRDLDILVFEDPFPLTPSEVTRQLVSRSPVPVMVELQANSLEQVRRFLELGAPAIEIKVPRMGFRQSQQIRQLCEHHGALIGVGLYGESGLGSLFSLHLHGSHPHFQGLPAENCFFLKLQQDLLAEPLQVVDGKVTLPSAPGVGGVVDERAVKRFGHTI